jgi:RNA polymerase sigma-70 factor (ECF subfamily)
MTDQLDLIYERLLVVRCQAGDEGAFAELVLRYDARLRYFVRKLVGDAHRADDLVQDVWLDVHRHLARLNDPQAFRAWIYRIARDRAFGQLRKAQRAEHPLGEIDVPDDDSAEDSFSEEDAAAIHVALDRLPAEQREVLVLRFLEAMSYDEIARATGLAIGTVRSRLHYGKQTLRNYLET